MRLRRLLLALMISLLVMPRLALADMDLSSIIAILTQMNSIQLESIKGSGINTVEQLKSLQSLLKGNTTTVRWIISIRIPGAVAAKSGKTHWMPT